MNTNNRVTNSVVPEPKGVITLCLRNTTWRRMEKWK